MLYPSNKPQTNMFDSIDEAVEVMGLWIAMSGILVLGIAMVVVTIVR